MGIGITYSPLHLAYAGGQQAVFLTSFLGGVQECPSETPGIL